VYRLGLVTIVLALVGGLAFLLVDRPWDPALTANEAGRALQERLHTEDRYDCEELNGMANPGEPDWDYLCSNATHPARMSYFVQTADHALARIEVAG
jgi:hypothetical protein